MDDMRIFGFQGLELWEADTVRAVEVEFVAKIKLLTEESFAKVFKFNKFYSAIPHPGDFYDWKDYVQAGGLSVEVVEIFGAVKCSDIRLKKNLI